MVSVALLCCSQMASARVDKSTRSCNSGSPQVDCRIIETRTNYKDDGSGDWLQSSDAYQFRSRNGLGCKIRGELTTSSNTKLTYSSTYANKSGEWSAPGLVAEQRKEGGWSYNISWNMNCK
jgi:hypothetical protein